MWGLRGRLERKGPGFRARRRRKPGGVSLPDVWTSASQHGEPMLRGIFNPEKTYKMVLRAKVQREAYGLELTDW